MRVSYDLDYRLSKLQPQLFYNQHIMWRLELHVCVYVCLCIVCVNVIVWRCLKVNGGIVFQASLCREQLVNVLCNTKGCNHFLILRFGSDLDLWLILFLFSGWVFMHLEIITRAEHLPRVWSLDHDWTKTVMCHMQLENSKIWLMCNFYPTVWYNNNLCLN